MVAEVSRPSLPRLIFLLTYIKLLGVCIFGVNGSIVRFLFFFTMCLIVVSPVNGAAIGLLVSSLVLCFRDAIFHTCCVLVTTLTVTICYVLHLFRQFIGLPHIIQLLKVLLDVCILMYTIVFITHITGPSRFRLVVDIHSTDLTNHSTSARTSIAVVRG